ncbi:MAG: hypothetical protein KC912_18185 [Proteobacteria bacterium]|nr:hypothetical protein [Pseudomonadota bacterium]
MKVVAHPLVVAVALGLLGPTALASDEKRGERDSSECREEIDTVEIEHFDVSGDAAGLPETVYLTLD